jgi:energy-coupling factor transporter transmembrane protein EcfT
MINRRWWLLIAALAVSSVTAFFLRDVVYKMIVVPIAYLIAVVAFYYSFVPQLIVWILMLVILGLMLISSFTAENRFYEHRPPRSKPVQGPVEVLAAWMLKAREGIYYKWLIAHRLGRLARGLGTVSEVEDRSKFRKEAIEKYLDAGLNKSFADYPRPSNPFTRAQPTPLDLYPKEVIDYLESKLEWDHGRDS